jgi:hypothetical protein
MIMLMPILKCNQIKSFAWQIGVMIGLSIFFMSFLIGCSAKPPLKKGKIAEWKGLPFSELKKQWGLPVNGYQLPDGRQVYVYETYQSSPRAVHTSYNTPVIRNQGNAVLYRSGDNRFRSCTMWVVLADGKQNKIQTVLFKGEACQSGVSAG